MSSDIWHHHHHQHHHQQQQGFDAGAGSAGKRSRSVMAMSNHSSETNSNFNSKNRSQQAGTLLNSISGTTAGGLRRPTYSGSPMVVSSSTKQTEDGLDRQRIGPAPASGDLIMSEQSNGQQQPVTKGRHQHRQQQRQMMMQQQQQQIQNGFQHRLRRQNSEDNSNYSADHPPGARNSAILQDQHFRRAGSQPAAADRLQVHLSSTNPTTTTGGSCTSSGVSSTTSSTLAANCNQSPTTSSSSSPFRRRHLSAANKLSMQQKPLDQEPQHQLQQPALQQQQHKKHQQETRERDSWMSRMKRGGSGSGSGSNHLARARLPGAPLNSRRRHSGTSDPGKQQQRAAHLLSLSLSTSDGSRSSSELRDEPEEYDQLEEDEVELEDEEEVEVAAELDDEEESNDIYSTPNDSIQSVPNGQRALPLGSEHKAGRKTSASSQAYPIIKSFSTNNFHLLAQAKQAQEQQAQRRGQDSTDKNCRQRLNGSRFFISSSSSEDSQPTKQVHSATDEKVERGSSHKGDSACLKANEQQPTEQRRPVAPSRQPVPLGQGVHSHSAGPMRPQSLLLPVSQESTNQFLVPVQILSPAVGPSSTATVYLGATPTAYLRSAALTNCPRSASLFEFAQNNTRFSSKYPAQLSSFQQQQRLQQVKNVAPTPSGDQNPNQSRQSIDSNAIVKSSNMMMSIPNSISMYDFKQNLATNNDSVPDERVTKNGPIEEGSEYKLAQMMLESGSNPNARDSQGNTALMLAVLSDNLPAVRCLIEHGANLNETNLAGMGVLDLICTRQTRPIRLEMLKTLIDNGADLDGKRRSDGSRLLDRLIADHQQSVSSSSWAANPDRMAFIECLLESGAKLGSSTWSAAQGKLDVQLSLLRKLCQDGYFLYKQNSIEAAVYRFEYALRRIAELERDLSSTNLAAVSQQMRRKQSALMMMQSASALSPEMASIACRKMKYQTYLGLSRCERRRKFFKRALEFAQLAILVDSTSYEAFYSKAHILKDLGEVDDSLVTIDQTARLIEKTIDKMNLELKFLEQQEASLIMDNCFEFDSDRESCRNQLSSLTRNRHELEGNLDYLLEARKYVAKMRQDIMEDKFKSSAQAQGEHRD